MSRSRGAASNGAGRRGKRVSHREDVDWDMPHTGTIIFLGVLMESPEMKGANGRAILRRANKLSSLPNSELREAYHWLQNESSKHRLARRRKAAQPGNSGNKLREGEQP
jgi:hypothetical protein